MALAIGHGQAGCLYNATNSGARHLAHLHLKGGVDIMILNSSTEVFPETCSFFVSAYGKFGAIHSGPIGDPQFLGGAAVILQMFRNMCKTSKAPKEYQSFIEPIAVIEAGQLAQKENRRVSIDEIWNRKKG